MDFKTKISFGLATLFAVSSAHGDELMYCHACSATVASNLVFNNSAVQPGVTGYVIDLDSGKVGAYTVYYDIDDSKSPPKRDRNVTSAVPASAILTAAPSAVEFYNTNPKGWTKLATTTTVAPARGVPYSSYPHISVYNVINSGTPENDFTVWANGSYWSPNLYNALGGLQGMLAQIHLGDASAFPTLRETIMFPDGSHVDMVYDKSLGKSIMDKDSARDSHDNDVPYLGKDGKIHNLGGEHHFGDTYGNPSDETNFLNQLSKLHVTLEASGSTGSGSGTGGGVMAWVCVEGADDSGDLEYTCTSS